MIFGIIPFKFEISKTAVSISLMGIEYTKHGETHFSSIGFCYSKWSMKDRFIWILSLHFYNYKRKVTIKAILKNVYCECLHCNEMIWNNNSPHCSKCGELEPEDIIFVYREPYLDYDGVKQMKEAGYHVMFDNGHMRYFK